MIAGVKNLLCAQGRVEQTQLHIFLQHILRSKIQNLAAAKARAGRESPSPETPFLPALPERAAEAVGKIPESLILERVTGIEPVSSAWKADIKTIILYPQIAKFSSLFNCSSQIINILLIPARIAITGRSVNFYLIFH